MRGGRREHQDPPACALHEVRQAERHESNRRCEEELDGFLESLDGHADRRSGRRPAGVPDEDVDAAEGLDRSLDDCLEVAGIRDVAANG